MKYLSGACYMFAAFSLGIVIYYHGADAVDVWALGYTLGIILGWLFNFAAPFTPNPS